MQQSVPINVPKCDFNLFASANLDVITKANRMGLAEHDFCRDIDLAEQMATLHANVTVLQKELVWVLAANLNYGYLLVNPTDKPPFDRIGLTYYLMSVLKLKQGESLHWMQELQTHAMKTAFEALKKKVEES